MFYRGTLLIQTHRRDHIPAAGAAAGAGAAPGFQSLPVSAFTKMLDVKEILATISQRVAGQEKEQDFFEVQL